MSTVEATPQRHHALELLARYRAIFAAVWAARHQLAGPKRLADEAAFLPAALSLQDTPVHPAPRRVALLWDRQSLSYPVEVPDRPAALDTGWSGWIEADRRAPAAPALRWRVQRRALAD